MLDDVDWMCAKLSQFFYKYAIRDEVFATLL